MTGLDIESLKNIRIILGSGSVRRKELLKDAGLDFEVIIKESDEKYPAGLKGADIALSLSRSKADAFIPVLDKSVVVITADTIVFSEGMVLGKPGNKTEAVSMLMSLSGKRHEVVTGVTLTSSIKQKSFYESTLVTFDVMSGPLIESYIEACSPYDKAGGYGIQEWVGTVACARIEGSYLNVVGLPVQRLLRELMEFV